MAKESGWLPTPTEKLDAEDKALVKARNIYCLQGLEIPKGKLTEMVRGEVAKFTAKKIAERLQKERESAETMGQRIEKMENAIDSLLQETEEAK